MKFLLFFLFFTLQLLAKPSTPIDLAFVSLGSYCQGSVILKDLGLRHFAAPLDWIFSLDHTGLIKLIDDNFLQMCDENYLYLYPEGHVINTLYNIDFRHDWLNGDLLNELPDIREKYMRRAERFCRLAEIAERVIFVRIAFDIELCQELGMIESIPSFTPECGAITREQTQELYALLHKKFPTLKFILLIINLQNNATDLSDLDNIMELSVDNLTEDPIPYIKSIADPLYFDAIYRSPASDFFD